MGKALTSIMQDMDVHRCYLCGVGGELVVHHALHGYANRKKADRDGLIVRLCVRCHVLLHDKGVGDREIMAAAQRAWQRAYRKPTEAFIERYGKSYIE